MKLNFTLALVIAALPFCIKAQITVTESDFANAGDDVWMSTAQSTTGLSYQYAGPDTNWDFSELQYSSQAETQFLNPILTNPIYSFNYGNVPFNSLRSNIAIEETSTPTIPLVTVTDAYNFYYKNSSSYVQKGIGETLDGIPTNVPYHSPDTLYTFPLQYGNTNTSTSGYSVNITGLVYYGYSQTRTNVVDGWGVVATPYDTFDVLRMVSTISSSDSLYIDTFHFGFKLPLPDQRIYEWIANGEKEPVLEITTTVISGSIELINSIVYRDSMHITPPPPTAITGPVESEPGFTVFPNPASNNINIHFDGGLTNALYTIYSMDGRVICENALTQHLQNINTANWARGVYIVTLTTAEETSMRRVVVE